MDDWNAPQWTDFNASVMSDIDEYFNTEHRELDPVRSDVTPYASFTESPSSKVNLSHSSFGTPRSNGYASPAPTAAFGASNSRLNKTSDGLTLAMSGLRIKTGMKSLGRQSMTPSALRAKIASVNASLLHYTNQDYDDAETNTEEPRTVVVIDDVDDAKCPDASLQKKRVDSTSEDEHADNNATMIASNADGDRSTCKTVDNVDPAEADDPAKPQIIAKHTEMDDAKESTGLSAKRVIENRTKPETNGKDARSVISNPEERCDPSKRVIFDKKLIKGKPEKPRVLTSQVRRHSIAKYRRRSGQFVSLAEAVSRFQNGTPERFRSANRKDNKSGPVQKTKQTTMKLTCPMSPALLCKYRTRHASVPTHHESKPLAKPITKTSSTNPKPSKKITIKATSFPRSLTSAREKSSIDVKPGRKIEKIPPSSASSSNQKISMPPPKAPPIMKEIDRMLGDTISTKDASAMSTSIMSETMRKHTPCKKTVPTVVSTDVGVAIKDVEILHFGIPVGNDHKKITRTVPFSFETRNKESKSKKDRLKNQQIEAENSKKTIFHARPAPSFNVPNKTISVLKPKDNNPNKENTLARTLTLKERTELALKKKKEMMDQIVEQEKRARVFHAKPAPNFKPVFVRGNSTENLRALGGDAAKGRTRGISPVDRSNGINQRSASSGNQENKAPIIGNQPFPKLKNPLTTQNPKLKKIAK